MPDARLSVLPIGTENSLARCKKHCATCAGSLVALGIGCRRSAANSQPRGFLSPALHFSYPGNWKIANKTAEPENEQITLEARESADYHHGLQA